MSKLLSFTLFSILVLLALACGGGGGGGESSSDDNGAASLRLAGKEGDTLSAYSLSGNLIGMTTFDANGNASLTLSTNSSYILKVGVGGNALLETIVTQSDFSNISSGSLNVAINGATTWATKKVMMSSNDDLSESNIGSLITSASGTSSIYNLSLASASSMLSAEDLEEVKYYTLVNSMVIKSIDSGEFTYFWDSISTNMLNNFDAESSTSAETILSNAQSLATAIRSQISLSTPLTVNDFDSALVTLLGDDADARRMISGVQDGDASTTLSVLNSSSSNQSATQLYNLGIQALEDEDMLEAYQYFAATVTADPNNGKARVLLAMTRVLTLSLKSTRGSKDMLDIVNLEFDFIDNNHLGNDDGDDIDAIDTDLYEDPDDVSEVFSYLELEEYLRKVVLHELALSISDLNQVSSSAFSDGDLVITPEMQGYIDEDENDNEILPSSNILIDIIDVYALKAALEYKRFKINSSLMNNLEAANENDSGNTMKDLLIQGIFANTPYLEGNSTFSLSDTYSGSNTIVSDNFSTFTFKSGYPEEVLLSVDTPDGDKNILDVEYFDSHEISFFSSLYPDLSSITNPIYKIEGELHLTVNSNLHEVRMQGAFEGNTFEFFQVNVEEHVDTNSDNVFELISSYVMSGNISGTGTLAIHSTYEHIDGMDVQEYITNDNQFLTLKPFFVNQARSSLGNAITISVALLDMIQNLETNSDRIDHIIDNRESLERDDNSVFTDPEINSFQVFLDGVKDALDGPAIVDPAFLGSANWMSQSLNLNAFFTTPARTFFTDSQGVIIASTYNDPDTTNLLEASVRDEGNLFGQTPAAVGGANIADVYAQFIEDAEDWFDVDPMTGGNTSGNTSGNAVALNKTTLTGSAVFSDTFVPVMNADSALAGSETGSFTIQGSSTPGQVSVISGNQTFPGYINGLNIYVSGIDTESTPNEPFSSIIAFTDASFTEAVHLYTYKEGLSGTGTAYMELALFTQDSGSLSATDLGHDTLSGTAVMQHRYTPLQSSANAFSSFNLTASGNSFMTYEDQANSDNTFLLSTYGYSVVGARVNGGDFSIMCGVFDGSNLNSFTGFEVFKNSSDTYAMAHAVLGTVATGSINLTHNGSYAYAGTTLSTTNSWTEINTSAETTLPDPSVITNAGGLITLDGQTGFAMGPVVFVGKHLSSDHSLLILIHDSSTTTYDSYYAPSLGYDGSGWADFNRGVKDSGDLQYQE